MEREQSPSGRPEPKVASDPFDEDRLTTDMINMAHIKVAGIGGLGLVAMAIVVAFAVPRIGRTLAFGLGLGVLFAAVLVAWRWRAGPIPSSSSHAGANATLAIDEDDKPAQTS